MEFTTRLGLHFQTTRLRGSCRPQGPAPERPDTRPGRGLDQEDSDAGDLEAGRFLYATVPAAG